MTLFHLDALFFVRFSAFCNVVLTRGPAKLKHPKFDVCIMTKGQNISVDVGNEQDSPWI